LVGLGPERKNKAEELEKQTVRFGKLWQQGAGDGLDGF
jgi:hypothetical protein